MNFVGRSVRFYLLPQGTVALRQAIPSTGGQIDGVVADEDHLGVWISAPELESEIGVVLLKWEHFWTAVLDYEPEVPLERPRAGFRV